MGEYPIATSALLPDGVTEETAPYVELGLSGLTRYGSYVYEEFLKELQGPRGMRIYREMRDNDPVVGGSLFAVEQLLRRVSISVEPASQDGIDLEKADFLQSCTADMSQAWTDVMSDAMTMIQYGFAPLEPVYKRRLGSRAAHPSRYMDGRVGLRKLALRAQETLWRWEFSPNGGIRGMYQRSAPDFRERYIPIEKLVLFRPRTEKNNPEGRSVLRSSYRPWRIKKNLETIEAIGIERDLAGLPVAWIPAQAMMPTATAAQKALLTAIKKLVTNVKRDEQEGMVFPLEYDEQGHKLYDFTLLSTGGKRQVDAGGVIERYEQRMAQAILADVILVGHGTTGARSMLSEKVDLFTLALEAWLDSILEVLNRFLVPRLFALNTFLGDELPKFTRGPVQAPDLKELAEYINTCVGAQVLTPDAMLESYVRQVANLPALESGQKVSEGDARIGKRDTAGDLAAVVGELLELVRELQETA